MHKVIQDRVTSGYRKYRSVVSLVTRTSSLRSLCSLVLDPCGTARIGTSLEHGVVDSQLRVFGTRRLRVIDASTFPVIPDCRIQNVVYMVAEKVRCSGLGG